MFRQASNKFISYIIYIYIYIVLNIFIFENNLYFHYFRCNGSKWWTSCQEPWNESSRWSSRISHSLWSYPQQEERRLLLHYYGNLYSSECRRTHQLRFRCNIFSLQKAIYCSFRSFKIQLDGHLHSPIAVLECVSAIRHALQLSWIHLKSKLFWGLLYTWKCY